MSAGITPVLSYHAQQFRVRLEVTRAHALASPLPPADLIQRAKTKLESVKKEGKIAFYEIYEDKLTSVWKALRTADGQPSTLSISFTVAAGAPMIPGLVVANAGSQKPGVLVSTATPLDIKSIPREIVRASILKLAHDQGIKGGLFMPQLQSAIMRLYSGEKLDKFHVATQSSIPAIPLDGKIFTVMANKSRGEVVVFVGDIAALQTEKAIENLCLVVSQTIEKLKASGAPALKFLKHEMISCLRSSVSGPEKIGVGSPLAILSAMPVDAPPPMVAKAPVKKYLSFAIAEDKMSASITGFDVKVYSDPAFKLTKEFLAEQLLLSNVRFGLSDDLYAAIEEACSKRVTLNALIAAKGKPPVPGVEPYLHLVYKDAPKAKNQDAVVNIRDAQQRTIVQKGQFIAESRYKTPPELGSNIYGHPLQPTNDSTLKVTIGEGVQQREPGKFYAVNDGLPKFEDGILTIMKSFVHEGNVNLKSGNIYFDGPVEIKGDIEAGATVRVRGPLKVHGSISGGIVISKEPIEVMQSIVTGEQGKVICATQITADFIENSRIECDGSITVKKSLVSSHVTAGQFIHALAPDGVIGGGVIMCRGAVVAANIGFAKGARTKIFAGVDHKVMKKISIREKRLDDLSKAQERYKNEFRELAQKKENQLTLKHKALKESLKVKMVDVKPLIEKATAQLEAVKSKLTFSPDALIAASNVFAANCLIEVGGHGVVMEVDTIAAVVSAKKRRDTHICTYDELKNEVEKKLGAVSSNTAPAQDPKKAG